MGVKNLIKLVYKYAPEAITLKKITDYKNKVLGIDANLMIYKMVYGIRKNGYDLYKGDHIITHIHAMLNKLIGFRKYNIKPVFVFDSGIPTMKIKTMESRKEFQKQMKLKYEQAKTDEERKKYYFMKSDITNKEINDCKILINIFGYQIIEAKEEADAELAYLSKRKLVYGIVSDDMDILVFGGKKLLKNFTISDKKKIQEINLDILLKKLHINQSQLIDISIMLGCDYCQSIKGIGIVTAYKMVKTNDYNINVLNYEKTFKYFKSPPVTKNVKINKINKIQIDKLQEFLYKHGYDKNGYDESKLLIDKVLKVLKN